MKKKKIIIFGSTGSIGKNTLKIINQDFDNFEIILLTSNKNINLLFRQATKYKVKNLIITNHKKYLIAKKRFSKKFNIYCDFKNLDKIIYTKVDYIMSAITGLAGLEPTLNSIPLTRKIAIANKESIICGWNLIKKKLLKYNTKFIPVDSEHFSLYSLIDTLKIDNIENAILTASGGPFLNLPLSKFSSISIHKAINHPNWKMGNKISIDSATMMNKVFEIIEAQRIFNIKLNKLSILVHPKSYVHAIVKFKNGLIKTLIHETSMTIPIFNSIYDNGTKNFKTKKIDLKSLNNLDFKEVDVKRYPITDVLKEFSNKVTLFDTIVVAANDELVSQFLNNNIKFIQINKLLKKIIKLPEFLKYKRKIPMNIVEIINLNDYVRLKTKKLSVLS